MTKGALPKFEKTAAQEVANTVAFDEVVDLIDEARRRAHRAVNVELIDSYWKIGAVISRRIQDDGWGKGTVGALSAH